MVGEGLSCRAVAASLYERLGGAERIAAILEDALDRHAVNPVLAARLRGKDLLQLKALCLWLVCAGTSLSGLELAAAIADVVAALEAQGVGPGEVNEVVAILDSLKCNL